jgi:RimJ/RimL family protein N-acetyltransferase
MHHINNNENIAIYPCTPRYALSHMEFIQAGKGFYDKYLELDKFDFQANIMQHTKWLIDESKSKEFPIYFLLDGEKVIGKFIFSPGNFMGGIQLAYFMHPKYTGRGLASFAVEQLSQMDFYNSNHLHVELHIDVENKPSQRVAEKCGFQVIDTYDYRKIGFEGSGFFEVWAKTNNLSSDFWVQIPRDEWQVSSDWVPGTRYNVPEQARNRGRNTFSGNRQERRSRGNRR